MAGPLTSDLRIALFQILELPLFPKQGTVYPDGSIGRVHDLTGQQWAIPTLIDNHLTSYIYPDPTYYSSLVAQLNNWIALGNDTTSLQQGSIGNVTGIDNSVRDEREEIRRQVMIMVPYYRYHEEMERRRSGTIEIIR